jgi:hypothetical protein
MTSCKLIKARSLPAHREQIIGRAVVIIAVLADVWTGGVGGGGGDNSKDNKKAGVGNLSPAMGARNQLGIWLSYRPASLCSLAIQFKTGFLELIPRPIAGLKFPTLVFCTFLVPW